MFGYWSSFLPDSPYTPGANNLNILTTILKDPSPQVRLGAVAVLTQMMKGAKPFFSLVDDKTLNHASFTTASSTVTTMVKELHRSLLLALISENLSLNLIQILKCYVILADVVPYKKLDSSILLKLLTRIEPMLSHKDLQIQVATLTVYGSFLNSEQIPDDVIQKLIICNNEVCNATSLKLNEDTPLPWIINVCKKHLEKKRSSTSPAVCVESLQVLKIICGKHFHVIRSHINSVEKIILDVFNDKQSFLQLHGAKLLEVVGRGILNDCNNIPSFFEDNNNFNIIFQFWDHILHSNFNIFISDEEQPTLQSVCCNCLSTIPSKVFEQLPRNIQAFCITVLLGMSVNSDSNIRGAAVRCLGVYSLFPSLREDMSFISDAARILVESIDDNLNIVRGKAAWALGNISDALLLSRNEYPDFADQVTIPFLCSIGLASIKAANDQEQIKAHAVRTLGNLLHYLPSNFLGDAEIITFIQKAEDSLLSSLSSKFMKVCWNACYALGNVLKNKDLLAAKILNLEEIITKLMSMLLSSNSKVQINAALALTSLASRNLYGEFFPSICHQFISVLNTSESKDFKELMHFENLCDTMCHYLCSLLLVATVKDLEFLYNICLDKKEILLTSFSKFGERAPADKINVVFKVYEHIENLEKSSAANVTPFFEFWKDIFAEVQSI